MKKVIVNIDAGKKQVVVKIQPEVGGVLSFEMLSKLKISEDLKSEAINHASEQVWWESLLSELRKHRQEFEMIEYQQYIAHWRRYAKYIMVAKGEKDTIEARMDLVSLAFSELASEESKRDWANLAYKGWSKEQGNKEEEGKNEKEIKEFVKRMYILEQETPSQTFETVTKRLLDLKRAEEGLSAIVEGFKQKGIFISVLAGTEKALMATSVGRYNQVVEEGVRGKVKS